MSKLLAAASAFALLCSAPAFADSAKEEKGCACQKSEKKECKCGDKCKCADCPVHGKKGEKKDAPKKA